MEWKEGTKFPWWIAARINEVSYLLNCQYGPVTFGRERKWNEIVVNLSAISLTALHVAVSHFSFHFLLYFVYKMFPKKYAYTISSSFSISSALMTCVHDEKSKDHKFKANRTNSCKESKWRLESSALLASFDIIHNSRVLFIHVLT